jgi:hypothetical protein
MNDSLAYFYADIMQNVAAIAGGLAAMWFISMVILNAIRGNDDWEI